MITEYTELLNSIETALGLARFERDHKVDSETRKVFIIIVNELANARHNIKHHLQNLPCDCVRSKELYDEVVKA